ncbi:MAG: hypothetical protein AVO33_03855 [delta proteobacterium ML8_F1]|nr:MAG: hypothetical protein AVO33_03855 [delta proteobacterium ML8_F1]
MKTEQRNRNLNIISAAIIAFFSAQVIHEMVHFLVGLLYDFEVLGFHLFAVNIQFGNPQDRIFEVIMVEASASIVNIIIAFASIGMFYNLKGAYAKLLAMLMAGFHGMMGFGYLLFDGLLYSPGAAGDWKAVLDLLNGNGVLRIAIILIGAIGYMGLFFWLGKAPLMFLTSIERMDDKARLSLGLKVLILPYVLSVLFNVPLAFWHPLGFPEGFFVVFFQYIFGYSGFVTAFFMLWVWLKPRPFMTSDEVALGENRETLLLVLAGTAVFLQFLLAFAN